MIQRIQSLLLLVAAVVAIVITFIPVGELVQNGIAFYQYDSFSLKLYQDGVLAGSVMHTTYVALLWYASAVLSLVTIFCYKKRPLQIRLNSINMLVMLIALAVMLFVYPDLVFAKQASMAGMEMAFNYWIMVSFLAAVALFFANRAIKSDEKKVRAADRLR
ncbi:MAG: DUF4293 domain-containing protein [Bacteroidales bacterium]|nr:DUF4293 domain-containing protein [Bacteroidales bacterium]